MRVGVRHQLRTPHSGALGSLVVLIVVVKRTSGTAAAGGRELLPAAEISLTGTAQCAASSRPLPGAETALILYHRYFFAVDPPGERRKPEFSATWVSGRGPQNLGVSRRWASWPQVFDAGCFAHNYMPISELRKDAVSQVTVGEESAGQRIDNFLMRLMKGVPKSHVYRILRSGEVRLNRGRVGPDARVAVGDVVRVPPVRVAVPSGSAGLAARPAPKIRVPILYEDDAIVVVDKPAGLAVHGGSGIAAGLIEQMRAARPDAKFLELVHRLDRDTSGVMLLAKKRAALVNLHAQLREGGTDKRYLVLVRGRWRDEMRRVRLALHKFSTKDGERRVRVDDATGQEAETIFRRERTWPRREPPLALLEAELCTGRTHQIRVHLTHIGFPLAGDDKYGDFAWNKTLAKEGLKRMFLHAKEIAFTHPASGERVRFESPLPPDLAAYLASLPDA